MLTDPAGNFAISGIPVGSYMLQVTADDFVPQLIPIDITDSNTFEVHVLLVPVP